MSYFYIQRRVLDILEPAYAGDRWSRIADVFIYSLIVINVIVVTLESMEHLGARFETLFFRIEMVSILVFSAEYFARVWAAPSYLPHTRTWRQAWGYRLEYMLSFNGIVDLISIVPFYLQAFVPNLDLRVLRALRLLRILKLSNYNTALDDLFAAMYEERRAFMAAFYLFMVAMFLSSSLIYFAESRAQPEYYASIPDAMYWSVITLTTVGYGDVSPITPLGKVIAGFTAIMGVCVVAMLTGILANAFTSQLSRRTLIFEERVRQALADGVIDHMEREALEELRVEFGLSQKQADALIKHVKIMSRQTVKKR